jgi:hypothetical protein
LAPSEATRAREVPPRCAERGADAFTGAVADAVALRMPVAGVALSVVRRSGWSEVMHLASVGGHPFGAPGEEEAGAM